MAIMKYHYSFCCFTYFVELKLACVVFLNYFFLLNIDLCGRHSQVGSLAGAAHLLNDNAGVLR